MKKYTLSVILFFIGAIAFAQTTELETSFNAFITFFVPGILAGLSVLFADAKKWMDSGEWSWKIFISTKIKPFLFSIVGGIAIYHLLAYLPYTKTFIETLGGSQFAEITAASLMGMATAIINSILKTVKKVDLSD